MRVATGAHCDGANLAELINIACAGKRNFTPVTEESLLTLWSRNPEYAHNGLLLVRDDNGGLLGATHALFDGCTRTGYLPFLLSRPGLEASVWPLLLSAGERHMHRASRILIGSPYTPLYCALEGRFQPLWGTTEVMEPEQNDEQLVGFLKAQGFRPRYTHLAMTIDLKPLPTLDNPRPEDRWEILQGEECWLNNYVWYGGSAAEEFGQYNPALHVLLVREDYNVVGHIAWYPMRESHKAAICDLAVMRRHRRQGIGSYLLRRALACMLQLGFSQAELCTTRNLGSAAYKLYLAAGFQTATAWLEMSKSKG